VLSGVFVLLIAAAVVLWQYTPLAEYLTPQRLSQWLGRFRDEPWAPFAIVGLFVVGGLIVFPVLLLIAATSVVLEPASAFVVTFVGTLASAMTTYAIGARFVRGTARNALGPTLDKVGDALATRGVLAIATIRLMPVAPFTVINVAAGSLGVRLSDFLLGTLLGMAPGVIAITAFGQQLRSVLEHPTPLRVAALVGIVAAWIGLSLLLQRLVARKR
jgi:uncharacterized membrane protein YdjX (TVP38/TMEM64 family)